MSDYLFLLPLSIGLGLIALVTFLWTLKRNQYDDLDGARYRILDKDDYPLPKKPIMSYSKSTQCDCDESTRNVST